MTSRQIRPKTLITIAAVIIILLVGALWYRTSHSVPAEPAPVLVETVDRGLTPERMADYQQQIDTLSADIEADKTTGKRDIGKLLALGILYYQKGELARANEVFLDLLRTNPQDTPSMEALGQSLMEMGDYEAAADMWMSAVNISPTETIYIKLVDLIDAHVPERKELVQGILEAAIGNLGQSPGLLKRLAQWYMEQKRYEEAISHYEVASRLAPDDATILEALEEARAALAASNASTEKPRSR